MLPDVRLLEALPASAHVEQRARRHRVDVVVGDAVVGPEEEIAVRDDPVDLAVDGVAGLAAIVARVTHEQLLLVGQPVIDARRRRVERVVAGIDVEEVVPPLIVRRLIRQRIELQRGGRNRVDAICRDDVPGKRLPHDAGADLGGGGRIVDDGPLRQQRREVAVAHRLRRHRLRQRLGERVVEPLHRFEEEGAVRAQRPAE